MSQGLPESAEFQHSTTFVPGELTSALGFGPLETQYGELFSEVLEDGIITADERARLERAADNLGLDRSRLLRLEQAMVAAHQVRHKVEIIEHYEEPAQSLSPLRVEADGDAGRALLLKRIEQLEARVKDLEGELRRAQASVNVEVDLTAVEDAAISASEDPEEVWRRLRQDPTNAELLRRLYRIHAARHDQDAAFLAAQALVVVGAATPEERALFETHRGAGLMTPRASISPAAWADLVMHPEQEILTGQIFATIAPAVLVGRVTALRRDKKLHQPSPEARQEPAKTTISAVRAVPWAAALLGLPSPGVFVEKERDVAYQQLPGIPPCTVVGKRALSGKTQLAHAFLVARHLTHYRAEHFLKSLFHSVQDLEDLFLAALTLGNPALPIAEDMKRRVKPLAEAIAPLLEPVQLDTLRGCFLRFVEEGGRTNLLRWSRAADKTASRAGLVACNDLLTATELLAAEEGPSGELAKDLLCFATSERYSRLRRQLGVALPS